MVSHNTTARPGGGPALDKVEVGRADVYNSVSTAIDVISRGNEEDGESEKASQKAKDEGAGVNNKAVETVTRRGGVRLYRFDE